MKLYRKIMVFVIIGFFMGMSVIPCITGDIGKKLVINNTNCTENLNVNLEQIDQEQSVGDEGSGWSCDVAQSFKPTLNTLTRVELFIKRVGNPSGNLKISICSSLGGYDLTSITVAAQAVPQEKVWYSFNFQDITVTPGETYYIVYDCENFWDANDIIVIYHHDDEDLYPNGEFWVKFPDWKIWNPDMDSAFKTYGMGVNPDDNYEENDEYYNAYDLSNDEETWLSSINGMGIQADDDWYEIYVNTGYEQLDVDLTFIHAAGDIDLELYDSSGSYITGSTSTTDDEYIDYEVSSSGTYYLKVFYGDAGNQYDLWWDDVESISNNPPNKPSTPDGSSSGYVGNSYVYSSSTTDPEGDQVWYQWDLGDEMSQWEGPYNSGQSVTKSHIWTQQGVYNVMVRAKDTDGARSVWSDVLFVTISEENQPPSTPSVSGPTSGGISESLTFSTSTTDPDGDQVKYGWDWDGDDDVDEWSGYLSSGSTDSRSHSWNQAGLYQVKVRARDSNGEYSSWSSSLTVTISEESADPDLDCSGSLSWSSVEPGGRVTGSFTVRNVGDSGSRLDWKVDSYPSWGDDWEFTPESGDELAAGDSETVEVFVVAPDVEESTFSGEILVMNEDDNSDYETISVSLSTPKNRVITNPLFQFFEKLLQNNPNLFPLLRNILGL